MTELREKLNNIVEEKQTKILPENIKEGVTVFDVTGEYKGLDTSDATATAADIALDKTAYVNGERIVGTMEVGDYNAKLAPNLGIKGDVYGSKIFKIIKSISQINLSNKNSNYLFYNCSLLENIPPLDLSVPTRVEYMFQGCYSLKKISLYNTTGVTSFYCLANGCTSLEEVEIESFVGVTDSSKFTSMFYNCTALTDTALNNILQVCTTASCTSTLKLLGLTEAQATVCTGLSNYQAFLDSGWTTGY